METTEQELKNLVKQKYSEIALQDKETNMKLLLRIGPAAAQRCTTS